MTEKEIRAAIRKEKFADDMKRGLAGIILLVGLCWGFVYISTTPPPGFEQQQQHQENKP